MVLQMDKLEKIIDENMCVKVAVLISLMTQHFLVMETYVLKILMN